ncbi:YybS family protein [Desulfocicer niacini]
MDQLPHPNAWTGPLRDILTGVSACLVIVSITIYVPLLGFLMAMLLPMPVLFYRLKLGRTSGAIIATLVLGVIATASGELSIDTLFYGALLLTGFMMGECMERNFSVARTGLYTGLTILAGCMFLILAHSLFTGKALLPMVSTYVGANLDLTMQLYSNMGIPQENMDMLADSMDTIKYVLVRILPSLIISMLLVVIWSNILFIRKILAGKGVHLAHLTNLNRWKAPEHLVWLVIAFGICLLFPARPLKIISLNFLIVLMPIYFFQGIAIVSFFFEKKKFPRMLKIFIYSIIALQQIFLLVVVGLGFFDTWVNFRKIDITETTVK